MALVAPIYFVAAKIGLSLAFAKVSVSAVWPSTGVATAALLCFGYRATPGVLIGALLGNYLLTDVPLIPSTTIAIVNTLEAVTAAYLLRQFTESPFESGYDLIRQIRALPSDLSKIPAVALTAFASEKDRQLALSAGFQMHLAKPVEPAALVETIGQVAFGRGQVNNR